MVFQSEELVNELGTPVLYTIRLELVCQAEEKINGALDESLSNIEAVVDSSE
jgi:hypothetical protein